MLKTTVATVSALAGVELTEQLPISGENTKIIIQIIIGIVHGVITLIQLLSKNKKVKNSL